MNTGDELTIDDTIEAPAHEASPAPTPRQKLSPPAAFLRWVELRMLTVEHAKLHRQFPGDAYAWWLSTREAVEGPFRFSDFTQMLVDGQSPLLVLHISETENEDPNWHRLAYRSLWQKPTIARWWPVAFWTLGVLLGRVAVDLLPYNIRHPFVYLYWLAAAAAIARHFYLRRKALHTIHNAAVSSPAEDAEL